MATRLRSGSLGCFFKMRKWSKRPHWLADDAVRREPVSAPNSLLTGKNAGKFAKSGPRVAVVFVKDVPASRALPVNFLNRPNREFVGAKQRK
jgi:hypothetical protein